VGGVVDRHQSAECPAVVQPLAAHEREAQRSEHRPVTSAVVHQHAGDALHLTLQRVELAGAVASVDEQLLAAVDDAGGRELHAAAAALGVDYRNAGGADGDVVDVRPPAAGDTPVVHQDYVAAVKALLERAGGRRFALGALAPGVDVSWFAGQRRGE
jgi:hypothetical protein